MAVNFDAGLIELHILVDVGGVSATTLHHESDGAPDIDLGVASLGSDPVRRVLAADQTLHDGALRLEVLGNDIDIARPGTLGAAAFWKENDPFCRCKYRVL